METWFAPATALDVALQKAAGGFTPTYGLPVLMGSGTFEPDATTYTIDPAVLGTPHAHRRILVFFGALSTGSTSTVGVTVNGITTTVEVGDIAGNRDGSVYSASIPTDGTGGVVITRSDVTNRLAYAYFVFYSTSSARNSRSGANPGSTSSATSLGAAIGIVPAGGFGMAYSWRGAVETTSWAASIGTPTKSVDLTPGAGLQFSVAYTLDAGAQTLTASGATATQMRVGGLTWGA